MRSFKLTLGVPAATSYLVQASADGLIGWATTDTVAAAALVDLLDGTYRLDAPNSPTDQYVRIIPTDGTLTASAGRIYQPQVAAVGFFDLRVDAVSIGLPAAAGWAVVASGITGASVAGKTVVKSDRTETDTEGVATLRLRADIGMIAVTVGSLTRYVDSTGRSGTEVSFADLS
jgi:hypothetical protein